MSTDKEEAMALTAQPGPVDRDGLAKALREAWMIAQHYRRPFEEWEAAGANDHAGYRAEADAAIAYLGAQAGPVACEALSEAECAAAFDAWRARTSGLGGIELARMVAEAQRLKCKPVVAAIERKGMRKAFEEAWVEAGAFEGDELGFARWLKGKSINTSAPQEAQPATTAPCAQRMHFGQSCGPDCMHAPTAPAKTATPDYRTCSDADFPAAVLAELDSYKKR